MPDLIGKRGQRKGAGIVTPVDRPHMASGGVGRGGFKRKAKKRSMKSKRY